MKVLISFRPNHKYDNFEGSRMRKNIKGALELHEIDYTSSDIDYYDVAHLISPEEEGKITDVHNNGAPVVVSALYAEDDPFACFLERKKGNHSHDSVLRSKCLKMLNKADLVLVPCQSSIEFLRNAGVTSKIETCFPGINLARFDFSKVEEKEIFYRYYREDRNKKLVIAVGEYDSKMEGINAFITAAKKCPKATFYYIGRLTTLTSLNLKLNRILRSCPKNVHFVDVPPDDIYRSALLNATVFMLPGYKVAGVTSIIEAMAAKTQIIARKGAVIEGLLEDGVTAHLAEFSETLSSLTRDFLEGKIKPTTAQAYEVISSHTLGSFGDELIVKYQNAIKNNVNRRL